MIRTTGADEQQSESDESGAEKERGNGEVGLAGVGALDCDGPT